MITTLITLTTYIVFLFPSLALASEYQNVVFENCDSYPWWEKEETAGLEKIKSDFNIALKQGLSCMDRLGEYHYNNSLKLKKILMDENTVKTIACRPAELGGPYARATLPDESENKRYSYLPPHPGIALDPNAIGGNYPYPLDEEQIEFFNGVGSIEELERTQLPGISRMENLPQLLFHEVIHWLGYIHSSDEPDLTLMYEVCCFGEHNDKSYSSRGLVYKSLSCKILSNNELWESENLNQKWKDLGYDKLTKAMKFYFDHYE